MDLRAPFLLSIVLLIAACSSEVEVVLSPIELAKNATTAYPCPGNDSQIERVVITTTAVSSGFITASACGYPNSEYGPATVLFVDDSSAVQELLSESKNFWLSNESTFSNLGSLLEITGLIGNPFDNNEIKLMIDLEQEQITAQLLEPPNPVSIQGLMKREIAGSDLKLIKTLASNDSYRRYAITYQSGELKISGIMNIPTGDGPFPTLVLGHGYIDPDIYTSGRGLAREQDYLARKGFIVLHTDYRNHATSDDDPANNIEFRLGYVEDVVNAAAALRASDITQIDKSRIGYLGRSMGGGIGYQAMVAYPGVFDSYVLYAPTSANAVDNFNRWGRVAADFADEVSRTYGLPEDQPQFWQNMSAINYFERVQDPVLIHHGTLDSSCNINWSRSASKELLRLKKEVTFLEYDGEYHAFYRDWILSMQRTVKFLNQNL